MTKIEATHFIHTLFDEVWGSLDANKIPKFYHPDVVIQMGKQTGNYDAIVHRLDYVKHTFGAVKNNIHDVLVDGDKIIVRMNQTYLRDNQAKEEHVLIFIYQLRDQKIAKVWACIDPAVNYFAN